MDYIPIDKESVPYRFDIDIDNRVYTLEVHYNSRFDYFTIDTELEGEVISYGTKVVYGNPLFNFTKDQRLPQTPITPVDVSWSEKRVTFENLNESVFLVVGELPPKPETKNIKKVPKFDGEYLFDGTITF